MLGIILCVVWIIILLVVPDLLWFFYNRKCSYCGKRMKYKGINKENKTFVFYCPHCHRFEIIDIND